MTRSIGSIRRRPDGRYEARISLPYGGRRSAYATTDAGAREALARLIGERDQATPRRSTMTVGTWLDRWLGDADLRPRSRVRYATTVRLYLRPELGRIPLAKLTAGDVLGMAARMRARGLSPASIRFAEAVLASSLQVALRQHLVAVNVARRIDKPRYVRAEVEPPEVAELLAIIEAAPAVTPAPFPLLLRLGIDTGLRQGEALGLTWSTFDARRRTITVERSLAYGTDDLGPTKTNRSRRTLTLTPELVEAIEAERRRQLAGGTASVYIFATRTGRPLDGRNVLRWFHASCREAGVRRYRWHDLRHAWATRASASGLDIYQISRYLGHAQVATTANVYAHLRPESIEPLELGHS